MERVDPLIGASLGRYRLEALHRRSALTTVYRATDTTFDRPVAVKVLHRDLAGHPGFVALFLRECRATARLQHPHILPVYDVGEQDGVAYLVMQYVAGGSLRDRLDDPGAVHPLPVAAAGALLRPVAAALDYAHAQGILHRDVKPSNILLGADDTPLLADFSLAKLLFEGRPAMTVANLLPGTPEYLAPELGQNLPLDGRADLYSLGVVLYEAVTGRVPFRAESPQETPFAVMLQHLTAAPPAPRQLNPALSPAVEAVLLRALAKNPADRYPTGAALFEALAAALDGPAATVAEPAPPAAGEVAGPIPAAATAGPRTLRAQAPVATAVAVVDDRPPGIGDEPVVAGGAAAPAPGAHDRKQRWSTGARRLDRGGPRAAMVLAAAGVALLLGVGLLGLIAPGRPGGEPSPTSPATAGVPTPATALVATAPPAATALPAATATVAVPVTSGARPATATAGAAGAGRQEVILFAANRGGVSGPQIYLMRPDGREQQQLIVVGSPSSAPRIAPDGRSFVFSVAPRPPSADAPPVRATSYALYLARSDGSSIDELTSQPSFTSAWSWSPDGRWITFVSDRDGNWEIYRVTPSGDQVVRLTTHPARDGWPVWTPDGRSIIFVSDRDGWPQLYRMEFDGANPRRLITSPTHDLDPAVSPDGRAIVYSAQARDGTAGDIVLATLDGAQAVRLTSQAGMNIHPVWSPDGARIAFVSNRDGNYNIYVMNADGSGQTRLTDHPGDEVTPSWGYLYLQAP